MDGSMFPKQEPLNYTASYIDCGHSGFHSDSKQFDKNSSQQEALYSPQMITSNNLSLKYEETQIENQPPVSPNRPHTQNNQESNIKLPTGDARTTPNERPQCIYCPKMSPNNFEVHSPQRFNSACFYCSMLYKYKLNSLTCGVNGKYCCKECTNTAPDLQTAFEHYKTHLDESSCICDSNVTENLESPKNKIVPEEEDKGNIFQCSSCSYSGNRLQYLKRHMRTHTGHRPHQCEVCSYRAPDITSLRVHSKTHSGERPFQCSECPYRASQKSTLRNHFKVHTGEKPYGCTYCDYRSSNRTNLSSHIKTHTGEKPYSCPYCEYCSTQSSALKCHLRIHTGEKPYQCHVCPYKAAALGNLRSHIKVHKEE